MDGKFVAHIVLANTSAYQSFNIAPPWLRDAPSLEKGTRVRFVIEEVYKGSKHSDTVISYFVPVGNCR